MMSQKSEFSASRRAFLKLPDKPETIVIRPPWATDTGISNNCTSCGDCVTACPKTILRKGHNGKPLVDFNGKECTFCMKCADACQENVFDLSLSPPWGLKAEIEPECLQVKGISCQLCRDNCPVSAIKIDLEKRPFGQLKIHTETCTGCAACLAVCPENAIALTGLSEQKEVA
ncbi:MAG: ferredoxin-type protein NapF [Roseibium sp.]